MVWVDARSEYRTIIAICIVVSTLSITIVSARLCIRYKASDMSADNCAAGLSMGFALVYSVLRCA
jgi:hypothetical protein